jgi:DNA-binding NarL/FixJ family response regulator
MKSGSAEVYERLADCGYETLSSEELESLADAAFWLGRQRESMAARRKAYTRYRDEQDATRASRAAWHLFHDHFDLDETSAASGWLTHARRHAQLVPDQVEPGYVALSEADWARYQEELDSAVEHAKRARDTGRRLDDRDLETLGMASLGRMLIARGDTIQGLGELDEAMLATVNDVLKPYTTGWVHCLLLSTCEQLGDVRRASEWSDLALRWSEEHGLLSWFPGMCRVHRCEVDSMRGEWAVAEREALRAAEELRPHAAYMVAAGLYLAGEIRLRRGEFAGAEEAFRRAHELGGSPQPGLAQLRLAQGDVDSAAAALRSALAAGASGPLRRARLLAAHVEAELVRQDEPAARRSAAELDDLAIANRAPLLRAMAAQAQAAVLLDSDVEAALPLLHSAYNIYWEQSCPYDVARVRVLMGVAARKTGDGETARLEFDAARREFERLGAMPDLERLAAVSATAAPTALGLTGREVDVLRLVARGSSNREIASALVISEHTVARHLSNIFGKLSVRSRAAAAAVAHEHKLV